MIEDTIVAIASPPGAAARGIVRLSGDRAWPILQGVFKRRPDLRSEAPPSTYSWTEGFLELKALDGASLPCVLFWMAKPRSYTREDVGEIHLLGNPLLLSSLVEELCGLGARLAEPGEFTRRAFLQGRIDLSQAEAVIGLIRARSEREATAGLEILEGHFGRSVASLRDRILDLLTLLEASIDFSDQDIEIVSEEDATRLFSELIDDSTRVLEALPPEVAADGGRPSCLLFGPANAGKSSLFNALSRSEEAIVHPAAATTRDGRDSLLDLDGIEVVLRDTAGLSARDGTSAPTTAGARPRSDPSSRADAEAVRMTRRLAKSADLLLVVLDGSGGRPNLEELLDDEPGSERTGSERIVVLNKRDRGFRDWTTEVVGGARGPGLRLVETSAETNEGIEDLRREIRSFLAGRQEGLGGEVGETVLRHRGRLGELLVALGRGHRRMVDRDPLELATTDLEEALDKCREITGEGAPEELLDRIFSRFCIGK